MRRVQGDPALVGGVEFDTHPLAGRVVRSRSTGQVGVLTSQITRPPEDWGTHRVSEVYVRPVGGGIEWATSPDDIEPVPDDVAGSTRVGDDSSSRVRKAR